MMTRTLGAVTGAVVLVAATSAWAQAPAPATPDQDQSAQLARAAEIQAEVDRMLSLIPPGTPARGGGRPFGHAAASAPSGQAGASGLETFRVAYCSTQRSSGRALTVLGFTNGSYIFSDDPAEFAVMASACPASPFVSLRITSQSGQEFDWDVLTVSHQ